MAAPDDRPSELVELRGHLLDSGLLAEVLDEIRARGADYEISRCDLGRQHADPSYVAVTVSLPSAEALSELVARLQAYGANPTTDDDATLRPAPADGVAPDGFYVTTSLPTRVRVGERWLAVDHPERDCVIACDAAAGRAWTVPLDGVRAGTSIVCGSHGIQVSPRQRPRDADGPEPGGSLDVGDLNLGGLRPEVPLALLVDRVADALREARSAATRILWAVGSPLVTSGGGAPLAALVRDGWVDVLFAGNALAVADVEAAMFGGPSLTTARTAVAPDHGRSSHLRAVNAVRRAGTLPAAVRAGLVEHGIVAEAVRRGVVLVLAASVRDDALLPGVERDAVAVQRALRGEIASVGLAIGVASQLFATAAANLLPADVPLVVVDADPAVVAKLTSHGAVQRAGIVADAGVFLDQLAARLTD